MVDKCDYCGEIKPVRKNTIKWVFPLSLGIGDVLEATHFDWRGYFYKLICKDCSDAMILKYKKSLKESEEQALKEKKRWIKERDKILREERAKITKDVR